MGIPNVLIYAILMLLSTDGEDLSDTKTTPSGVVFSGAPQTIRTSDLSLRRGALYPAELGVPGGAYRIVLEALGQCESWLFLLILEPFLPYSLLDSPLRLGYIPVTNYLRR